MKAYWVSLYTEILDQDKLKKYGENAIPVIKKFGGTPVVRGGKLKYYSGDKILRTVIWEFPSYYNAISCHDSEDYLKACLMQNKLQKDICLLWRVLILNSIVIN